MQNRGLVSFENTLNAFSHLSDYELRKRKFLFFVMNQRILTKIGSFFLKSALKLHFPINFLIKDTIYRVFCGGEDLDEVKVLADKLYNDSIETILDYGSEGCRSRKEASRSFEKIKESILFVAGRKGAHADFKVTSLINPSILEKYQRGEGLDAKEREALDDLGKMMDAIGGLCAVRNVIVMVDAEETWIQSAIDELVYDMMEKYNREKALVYNTIQMYRKDGMALLQNAVERGKRGGFKVGVKLVRGAYMEKENRVAAEAGRESPIQPDKAATDKAFDDAIRLLAENGRWTALCCATHNEKSTAYLVQILQDGVLAPEFSYMFAQLLGMSDHITRNLASQGYRVAKYYPYGPVRMVIPYLLRRAAENTSVAGQSSRESRLINDELKRRKEVGR